MSDEVQPVHLRTEGFWTDDAPDVPASEWYARCTAGVLHDPQGESIVCLCGLDTKEWPDGLEHGDSAQVGHLPRVEGPPAFPAWGVHPAVPGEQVVEQIDGVGFGLPDGDALRVEGLPSVSVSHPVGAALDADGAVGVDDAGEVREDERVHVEALTSGGDVTPFYSDQHLTLWGGDCRTVLRSMPSESVHMVCTSPPYWGLRDYGTATWDGGDAECDHRIYAYPKGQETPGGRGGSMPMQEQVQRESCRKCGARRIDSQLGLEPTPEAYVANMVDVFREVRRVLRDDGTLWLNLGDSYAGGSQTGRNDGGRPEKGRGWAEYDIQRTKVKRDDGLKPKDLVGIPWRVAFALQADGWYLRSDIIWAKPNPMPESVTDRPTKAHEYLFLLTKSPRYYYDAEAIKEPASGANEHDLTGGGKRWPGIGPKHGMTDRHKSDYEPMTVNPSRNIRSVWTIATEPYSGAHFATFPRKLVEPCVKAGCPEGGTVLDPFAGSGTTLLVAQALGRRGVGIDLNPDYLKQALARNAQTPLGLGAA